MGDFSFGTPFVPLDPKQPADAQDSNRHFPFSISIPDENSSKVVLPVGIAGADLSYGNRTDELTASQHVGPFHNILKDSVRARRQHRGGNKRRFTLNGVLENK